MSKMQNLSLKQLLRLAKTPQEKTSPNKDVNEQVTTFVSPDTDLPEDLVSHFYQRNYGLDLEKHKISSIDSIYLIKDFISKNLESKLNHKIRIRKDKYIELHGRRVQRWGGTVTNEGLIDIEELPKWSKCFIKVLVETGLFNTSTHPNHILVNHYDAGMGILPHSDGPAYFPIVTILSLNQSCFFNFYRRASESKASDSKLFSFEVPPRSLLIFKDKAYSEFLHGIEDDKINKDILGAELNSYKDSNLSRERISITFRHVSTKAE